MTATPPSPLLLWLQALIESQRDPEREDLAARVRELGLGLSSAEAETAGELCELLAGDPGCEEPLPAFSVPARYVKPHEPGLGPVEVVPSLARLAAWSFLADYRDVLSWIAIAILVSLLARVAL